MATPDCFAGEEPVEAMVDPARVRARMLYARLPARVVKVEPLEEWQARDLTGTARCEGCDMAYEDVTATEESYTCDDCGGAVEACEPRVTRPPIPMSAEPVFDLLVRTWEGGGE